VLALVPLQGCSSDTDKTRAPTAGKDAGRDAGESGGGHIYVTMMGDDEVAVVDAETHAVTRHIAVGLNPAILLGTPDRSKLYSANWGDDTLSSIDVASAEVTSIALHGRPWVIAMSPDGKSLYAGLGSNEIAVIDTKSDTVARTMPFDVLPASIIVSPDSSTLYVARLTDSTLEAISADTGSVIHPPIPVGGSPAWITILPDGSTVYTLNFLSGDVTVVDTATWQVTTTVSDGMGSAGIVGNVTPDGSLLCVTDYGTEDLSAIDTKKNAVAWTLPTEGRPVSIGFSPDGKRGYVGDYGPDSVAVTPADLITALGSGTLLKITGSGHLTEFDPKTGMRVGDPMMVGKGPSSLVVIP